MYTNRQNRFRQLCEQVKDTLEALFEQFPNAKIPLDENIDLMDYVIPSDFVEKCETRDEHIPTEIIEEIEKKFAETP